MSRDGGARSDLQPPPFLLLPLLAGHAPLLRPLIILPLASALLVRNATSIERFDSLGTIRLAGNHVAPTWTLLSNARAWELDWRAAGEQLVSLLLQPTQPDLFPAERRSWKDTKSKWTKIWAKAMRDSLLTVGSCLAAWHPSLWPQRSRG